MYNQPKQIEQSLRNPERVELANHSNTSNSVADTSSTMHAHPNTLKPCNNGPSITPHIPSIATAAVIASNGTALRGGTQCQITPQYLRIARKLYPACLRPTKLARRPGKEAWYSGKEFIAKGKDTNAIIKELIEKAKPVLADQEEATKLLQRRDVNARNFSEKQSSIVSQMNRILELKNRKVPAAGGEILTNGDQAECLAKKRPADDSLALSAAKKIAQENGSEPETDAVQK